MAIYQYKARDKFGKLVNGTMLADSESAVSLKLSQMNYIPISIIETKEKQITDVFSIFSRFRRVQFSDLNMFTRQLFTLQKAGLALLSSLDALKEQTSNKILKVAIVQITRDIEAGISFSSSLERHPQIFNHIYVNMVKAGEVSGRLDSALERLAALGEHEEKIRLRIKAATRYPIIVVSAIIIAFLVLTTLVMPRFAKIYSQFTVELPLPTQILLGINYMLTKFWWLLVVIFGILILLFKKFINTNVGRLWWDNFKLNVPIFGPLVLKLSMSRFARIIGTLMQSGVSLLQILELTQEAVGNKILSRTIENIKTSVNEGKGMSEPMKISGMFPPIVVHMVATGEETGSVAELLFHVSDYYDAQIDYTLNNLISLIEPILIFVLGCGVLFMALGVFLPIWNLMSLFRR